MVDLNTVLTGSDEFGSAQLEPQWHWVREDDTEWRLGDGSLIITSQQGDLQGSVNTAKNVALQDVDGDWTVDSRLVFSRPLANNNEQGGIIAYTDDDHYVKLTWEMSNAAAPINKVHVVLLGERNAVDAISEVTGANAQHIVGADGAIWFRMTKTGNTYKGYYSSDGSVYRFMGSTTLDVEPAGSGLVAFNRAGTSTDLDVAFDYFHIHSLGDPVP
jgi:alpha-glucuronidase